MVRQILNSSIKEYISLEDEISSIENYLGLQKVRYRDMFDYSIEIDEAIDQEETLVPPMLAQPFIENSIEHGIKHKDSKGTIRVQFKLNGNKMLIEVEDDGVGREKAHEIGHKHNKDHKSLATQITQDRIRVLNKKLKTKITMNIEDLKNEKGDAIGTKVVFEVPVSQA